ncbi:serine/threonine-protein kinase [Asanoa sp. NPDC050611]|uniref:serine/threonine-protein kinase n=1 Tax=Asanoa sp. NPDC050611 TaxID=3157098 RepID=UPI0034102B1A
MAARRLADRYELEEVLAEGGMGVVWRARDHRLGRAVAVKLVSRDALAEPTLVERFDREARAVALLNHPNIVAVYDFGSDGGDAYLVMELVDGRGLAMDDLPLSVGDAVAVAAQACAGLAAAHAAGIVHRDVKPANLIRSASGVVKICDFGIAHLQQAAGQARLTRTEIAMGSTRYMAPEQARGDAVDARTDLYGLGCTLYALLAGAPPFLAPTPLGVVHQHVTKPAPDVRVARPDVPEPLARLVEELLAKSPDDRPRDAAAVGARLAALSLPSSPSSSSSAVRPPAPVPAPPDRRRVWGIAAAGSAALAGVVLASLLAATRDGGSSSAAAPEPVPTLTATEVAAPATTPTRTPAPTSSGPTARVPETTAPPTVPPATRSTSPTPVRTPAPTTVPPVDPLVGLHRTIDEQEASGQLEPKIAQDLRKRVDDIATRLRNGEDADARRKITELRGKLGDLRDQGKLSPAGYTAMIRDLDRLATP